MHDKFGRCGEELNLQSFEKQRDALIMLTQKSFVVINCNKRQLMFKIN